MILRLSLDLPEDKTYLPMVRHVSRSVLEYLRATEQDIGDVEFIVGELTSNAVLHSGSESYRVELEFHDDRAIVVVADRGRGFSPGDVLPPGAPRLGPDGSERLGGWGLPMVEALSDRLQFSHTDPNTDPRGTTVRAEKTLRFPPPPLPPSSARAVATAS